MIVATAGHVDHGKTTLIRALTGVETDRLPEERARGMTIDLGFAYLPLPGGEGNIGFVDVPGHERFVRNMLAGVAGIDLALLVVAADDGPMPQTLEHLAILELLGVKRGLVALTKIDRVEAKRCAEVAAEIRALLAPTSLADSPLLPTAATVGTGVEELRAALFSAAGQARAATVPQDGHFRLAIDRRFILEGTGRIVTGTVHGGLAAVGDTLRLMPGDVEVRIRSVHAQNRASSHAARGQRCGLNLVGQELRRHEIHRGDWLVAPALASTSTRLGVHLRLARGEAQALRDGTPVHLHLGAADLPARVALLEESTLAPGNSMYAQLWLSAPTLAVHGDRFVLRDQSATRTLAGGEVLEAAPFPARLSRARRLGVLRALALSSVHERFLALLAQATDGLDPGWFARCNDLSPSDLAPLMEDPVVAQVTLPREGLRLFERVRVEALCHDILHAVRALHAADPAQTGLPEQRLRETLPGRELPRLVRAVTEQLVREGLLLRRASQLCDPAHVPTLSAPEQRLLARVTAELARHGRQAPALHDLPDPLQISIDVLKPFVERMARLGHLQQVGRYRYYLPEQLRELAQCASTLAGISEGGSFTAAQYKEYCGIGRNVTIEVLESLDRLGLTRRYGQVRRLWREVSEVFGPG